MFRETLASCLWILFNWQKVFKGKQYVLIGQQAQVISCAAAFSLRKPF